MPASKSSNYILVTSSGISLLGEKALDPLEFPQTVLDKLQVLAPDDLKQLVVNFASKIETKNKSVSILLAPDVLFQESIPLTDLDDVKRQSDAFFDEIPLEEAVTAKKTLTNDKEVYLIATNGELFSLINDAFAESGFTVNAILPISFYFGFPKDSKISKTDVESIFQDDQLHQSANFLTDLSAPESSDEGDGKPKKSGKKWLLLLILVIIIALLFFAGKSVTKSALFAKPTPTPTEVPPTSTPVPTEVPKDKGTITISVLNGTGTVGQASKVKNALVSLGYTASNITTDNASSQDNTTTTVAFSKKVSKTDQDELITELKKTFSDVSGKDADSTQSEDIVITTGK